MVVVISFTILLSLIVSWGLLVPIISGVEDRAAEQVSERTKINQKKESLLEQLEDLEYEYRSSKLNDKEYREVQSEIMAEIVVITEKLEGLDNVLSRAA